MSKWTDKPIEERRAIVARRDPEKVKAADRARYYRDREKRLEAAKEWRAQNGQRVSDLKRNWILRNPEKRAAHIVVGNAIRDGRLERQPCEVCGERAHAHHDDYSQPMDVRWLCHRHHMELHRKYA